MLLCSPLFCLADQALQRFRITGCALCAGHGGLHDFVDPLLADRLLQEFCVIVDIENLHVLRNQCSGGHAPEGGLGPGRQNSTDALAACNLLQMVQARLLVLEVGEGEMVGLFEVLLPDNEGELGPSGSFGHLPVLLIRHVQGIVDSTVECFKEHVGGVGILLTEINSRHLAQTTNGTAHRRDTKQTELHVHITEGLRAGGRKAEVCTAAEFLLKVEELGAHEKPTFELRLH
mmetsp:Transcript_75837/g.181432  ORF Transcript_75837/g.181432 Transcript_75837/m.181432 type:complete len:232 (+) Transcript_75837:392-1087(+)